MKGSGKHTPIDNKSQQERIQREKEEREKNERQQREEERLKKLREEEREREEKKRLEQEKIINEKIEKEKQEREDVKTKEFILRMTNAQLEKILELRKEDGKTSPEGLLATRQASNNAETFHRDNAFMRETIQKREKDEDAATEKKILEMDTTVMKKYMQYRITKGFLVYGMRSLGSLGTRKYTDTKEKYDADTAFMKQRLQRLEIEDEATKRFVDKMTIGKLQEYLKYRQKWAIYGREKRVEGKLTTRKLANTPNNYTLDTNYMVQRLKERINRLKSVQTSSQKKIKSIHSSTTTSKNRPPSHTKTPSNNKAPVFKPPSAPVNPTAIPAVIPRYNLRKRKQQIKAPSEAKVPVEEVYKEPSGIKLPSEVKIPSEVKAPSGIKAPSETRRYNLRNRKSKSKSIPRPEEIVKKTKTKTTKPKSFTQDRKYNLRNRKQIVNYKI
jgi:hypothetical protein